MNFFEKELRNIFEQETGAQPPWFSDNTYLGVLDRDLRVRAEFVDSHGSGCYDALKVTVLNRRGGQVDAAQLSIASVWDTGDKPPCICCDHHSKELAWVGCQPTFDEYHALWKAVDAYLNIFRDIVPCHARALPSVQPQAGRSAAPHAPRKAQHER